MGIDLASSPTTTAACVVAWGGGTPRILDLRPGGVDDDAIAALASGADATGIDSPFGWPLPFSEALAAYAAGGPWPGDRHARLWLRATDLHAQVVAGGRPPLSVSSDRIARPAVRAALLLSRLGPRGAPAARDGSDGVVEVYPAGALRCWGLATDGYKRPDAAALRGSIADAVVAGAGIALEPGQRALLAATDHALDALVAALVARAHVRGLVRRPSGEDAALAAVEGWLFLPTGRLGDLAGP